MTYTDGTGRLIQVKFNFINKINNVLRFTDNPSAVKQKNQLIYWEK